MSKYRLPPPSRKRNPAPSLERAAGQALNIKLYERMHMMKCSKPQAEQDFIDGAYGIHFKLGTDRYAVLPQTDGQRNLTGVYPVLQSTNEEEEVYEELL